MFISDFLQKQKHNHGLRRESLRMFY